MEVMVAWWVWKPEGLGCREVREVRGARVVRDVREALKASHTAF